MAPNPQAWMAALHTALAEIPQDATLTVLAHSLGAINWMHHAAMSERTGPQADRALLIAPPYVVREVPPLDAPPGVADFFPPPFSPDGIAALARETVLVASDTDDYATFDQSAAYADKLRIPIHKLPGGGHISPYYGYGEWPWVLDWALGRAELPRSRTSSIRKSSPRLVPRRPSPEGPGEENPALNGGAARRKPPSGLGISGLGNPFRSREVCSGEAGYFRLAPPFRAGFSSPGPSGEGRSLAIKVRVFLSDPGGEPRSTGPP